MTNRLLIMSIASIFLLSGCVSDTGELPESIAKRAEEDRKAAEGQKSLFARKDEFASLEPASKPKKQYKIAPKSAVVLMRLPGHDFEIEGWKKMADGSLYRCGASGCSGQSEVIFDSNRAESGEDVKTVIRVDCTKGRGVANFAVKTGGLVTVFGLSCKIAVIDLPTMAMVATETMPFEKVQMLSIDSQRPDPTQILEPVPPYTEYFVNPYPKLSGFVGSIQK